MVSVIGIFIWQEIKEIKSDVKALLAQSNIDKTRIDNLERMFYPIQTPSSQKEPTDPRPTPIKFIMTEFLPAKNEMEEEEDDKKYHI
jgi:hypothetical protein